MMQGESFLTQIYRGRSPLVYRPHTLTCSIGLWPCEVEFVQTDGGRAPATMSGSAKTVSAGRTLPDMNARHARHAVTCRSGTLRARRSFGLVHRQTLHSASGVAILRPSVFPGNLSSDTAWQIGHF